MDEDNDELNEVEQLELIVEDLTRRLKNAQHTIDTERRIASNAMKQTELYYNKLNNMTKLLRLESAKSFNLEQKAIQSNEAIKYDNNKVKSKTLIEQLRITELDHMMTGNKKEPIKLTKLRKKVQALEEEQSSQRVFLEELNEVDAMNENLTSSAQVGNINECNRLLRSGAWANYVDSAGYLALHYAAKNGHHDIVKLLLEFGADSSSYLTGHSPLVIAAKNGHISVIKLLLSFGTDIEDTGRGGCPATLAALSNSHFDTLEYLLDTGANIDSVDADENNALHIATRLSKPQVTQVISFLIERGCNVERINRAGRTPLQLALYEKNKDAVYALGGSSNEMILTNIPSGTANGSTVRSIEGHQSLSLEELHSFNQSENRDKQTPVQTSTHRNSTGDRSKAITTANKVAENSAVNRSAVGSGSTAAKMQRSKPQNNNNGMTNEAAAESDAEQKNQSAESQYLEGQILVLGSALSTINEASSAGVETSHNQDKSKSQQMEGGSAIGLESQSIISGITFDAGNLANA